MKLEDVEVGMKVVPHSKSTGCSFDKFKDAESVHRKNDVWLYVYRIGDDDIIELSPETDYTADIVYFLPEDFEQWCDADEAPEGYYAVAGQSCSECDFYRELDCSNMVCCKADRKDSCNIIFKKKISCKEAFDEIDKLSVTVETVLGKPVNTEGTIPTADPVNHPSHYTSGEIECIDAIKSAITGLVGMEAFCTGQILKYSWRWKHKNGKEDLEKARYYINKLIEGIEKELLDESRSS